MSFVNYCLLLARTSCGWMASKMLVGLNNRNHLLDGYLWANVFRDPKMALSSKAREAAENVGLFWKKWRNWGGMGDGGRYAMRPPRSSTCRCVWPPETLRAKISFLLVVKPRTLPQRSGLSGSKRTPGWANFFNRTMWPHQKPPSTHHISIKYYIEFGKKNVIMKQIDDW